MSGCTGTLIGTNHDAFRNDGDASVTRKPKTDQPIGQPENGFRRLGERLAKETKRSPFSIWLAQEDHFDRLDEQIKRHGVRWDVVAQWAMDEGLTDGQPLTALAARRTYEREAKRRREQPKSPPKAQPLAGPPTVRMIELARETPPPASDDAEARIEKLKRQMARRSGRES